MSDNSKQTIASASSIDLLLLVFIVLKLTHVIDWSWWWVLSPLWITIALVVLILIVLAIINK